jgi:error-prone DNA polymerase
VVPLEPAAMPGRVVVQWDKEDCADLGIIKVDLLGLGMMAALEESLELIRRDYGEEVDLAHLPPDDPEVYAALDEADTVGMFQIESRAQMSSLPRLRPKKFYDLVVQVAIIRPGPIVGRMVHPYIRRRQGREPVVYPHASLEPVLERTLGVPLFQEQLLRMAMIAASFSGGEAEELRRALGFKRSQARMREIEAKLRRGMERNGIPAAAQEKIAQSISSFALYGFPESHAASFALLAYASAYLKCHYPAAFTAALLNHQPMGFYHPATLVKDAQRHGLRVRPVDAVCSEWRCTLEPDDRAIGSSGHRAIEIAKKFANGSMTRSPDRPILAVRLGLCYVKGLREEAGQALVRARATAPFSSIADLARRVPELHKDELEALAEIGALNSVAGGEGRGASQFSVLSSQFSEREKRGTRNEKPVHRRDALWQVARAVRPAGPLLEQDLVSSFEFQASRKDEAGSKLETGNSKLLSPLAPMSAEERLVADFRGTGLTVGPHPMAYGRARLNALGVRRACELEHLPGGKQVQVAGCVIARQRPGTARGFVFLSLEDETGIANAIVTPNVFDQNRWLLSSAPFLLVEGRLQHQDHVVSVKAERIRALEVTRAETRSHDFH